MKTSHHHVSHHAASRQTSAEIYADHIRFEPAWCESGTGYHQWTIGLTVAGYCRYRLDTQDLIVAPGDLVLLRPHCWLSLQVCERPHSSADCAEVGDVHWEVVYSVFHPYPHWQPWLDDMEYRDGICRINLTGRARIEVQKALEHVARVYQSGGVLRDDATLNALEAALIELRRHVPMLKSRSDQRVYMAIEFIHQHFSEPLTVADIAEAVGLSADWLSRLFVAGTGVGPSQFLEKVRLLRAAEMLRFANASVADVAQASGYADAFYFTRRFRLHYGTSPSAYRTSMRVRNAG